MANKSVYQNFDTDALTHFELNNDSLYGVIVGSKVENVLCTQDQTTYEKIQRILTVPTEDDQTFRNKKKAFILPKCNVSSDRLKAALKEHGITVTNDYELADLVIGHDDISTHRLENGENIPSTVMMAKLWNYELTSGSSSNSNLQSTLHTTISSHPEHVIVTSKITGHIRYYDLDIEDSLYDSWLLTGLAVNIAHLIETTDLSVVDTETILHSSANVMFMDEQLLSDLTLQLHSNSDDMYLAAKVVPTICYKTNYHLLWQFAQDCNNITWNFNRDKDLQYWITASNFIAFERKSAQDMILWLEEEEKLCKTTFRYLETIVRKEIRIQNRDLYTFKVAVKKEYQQYLKKTT
jgi:hypothetical protein